MGLRTKLAKLLGYEKIRAPGRRVNSLAAISHVLGHDVKTVFDVGAYDGRSARAFRKKWPVCTVYSFEPGPKNFAKLERIEDPHVHAVPLALSDAPGRASFHVHDFGMTNSLLAGAESAVQTLDVEVDTIDAYCERERIEQIDLLKSDAQGTDLKVLQGAQRMLPEIRAIFCEVSIEPFYDGQAKIGEICSYLKDYRLFDFFDGHYSEDGHLRWADLLFYRAR